MKRSLRLDRRAFLKGVGGAMLALPVLDAMGAEVTDEIPRRFCAIYTANGMSLPKAERTPGVRESAKRALYRNFLNTKMWLKLNTPVGRMVNLSVLELEGEPAAAAQSAGL